MAGIGFALEAAGPRGTLTGWIASIAHGALIAAGPWIFTIGAIALIQRATVDVLPASEAFAFSGLVIYAFGLSLLATAPVVNVSIRLVADDIYLDDLAAVRPRYIAALIVSAAFTAILALIVFAGMLRLSAQDLAIAMVSTVTAGLVWPTLGFCGVVRDYRGISLAFLAGLLVATIGAGGAAYLGFGPAVLMLTFAAGISIVFFGLAARLLTNFSHEVTSIARPLRDLAAGFRSRWMLAVGSLLAIAAIWADKWIMWIGAGGVVLDNGLRSAPDYDGAMFVAYLLIIPALGMFVTAIETDFADVSAEFSDAIEQRAPLARIEKLGAGVQGEAFGLVGRVTIVLTALCAFAILASPVLAPHVGLAFGQIGMLRLGLVAALFQFLFLTCSALLLFFDLHGRFLALQALFFSLQVGLTLAVAAWGQAYAGYGHLLACAISAALAVIALEGALRHLPFLTFRAAQRQSDQPVRRKPVRHAAGPAIDEFLPEARLEAGRTGALLRAEPMNPAE